MTEPPVCGKCDTKHWRFHKCDVPQKPVHVVRQPLADGVRPWGNRLHSVETNGDVLMLPRKPFRVGGFAGPDGWEPPEAA